MIKTAKVLEDVKSGKGNFYCKAGDIVTIFQMKHESVWLCEHKGNKFPVNPNKLEYDTKRNGSQTPETGLEH